jgi:hypothetical protein
VTLYKSKPRQKILASWPGHLLHWQEERKLFDDPAEVYDIIPWDAEIMSRAVPQIEALECE